MKTWIKKNKVTFILIIIALAGFSLIAYPSFANWWNTSRSSRAVSSYAESVAEMSPQEIDRIIESALEYNERLASSGMLWTMNEAQREDYMSQLDITGTGMMGYIDIMKIRVTLPVYHTVEENVLQNAAGHIPGTSLPVGGPSSHCGISSHRGLPSARLFTDLDKLVEGDTFTLTVFDRIYKYEVDQIRVVEPNDVSDLYIEPGMDYCTLVTCTPYGINTQRLLIRGHRVENDPDVISVVADALLLEPVYTAPFIAIPLIAILLVVLMIVTRRQAKYTPEELDAQLPARIINTVKGKMRTVFKSLLDFLERVDKGQKGSK